ADRGRRGGGARQGGRGPAGPLPGAVQGGQHRRPPRGLADGLQAARSGPVGWTATWKWAIWTLLQLQPPQPRAMSHLPLPEAAVSPLLAAGLLLAAVPVLRSFDFAHPTVSQILSATGASRSRAYDLRHA